MACDAVEVLPPTHGCPVTVVARGQVDEPYPSRAEALPHGSVRGVKAVPTPGDTQRAHRNKSLQTAVGLRSVGRALSLELSRQGGPPGKHPATVLGRAILPAARAPVVEDHLGKVQVVPAVAFGSAADAAMVA